MTRYVIRDIADDREVPDAERRTQFRERFERIALNNLDIFIRRKFFAEPLRQLPVAFDRKYFYSSFRGARLLHYRFRELSVAGTDLDDRTSRFHAERPHDFFDRRFIF